MESSNCRLGNAIRTARMKKGYTQEMLSEILDITPGHLKHMESGKRKPSVPLLFQMMELLDFSVDELVFLHCKKSECVHLNGLTKRQKEAVIRLVDSMRDERREL